MRQIYLVTLVVAIYFAGVQSKHTLHVDNVYPNEGPTVLIPGPLHTDNIITDLLNVGSLTINSLKGLTATTDAGFTISGSSIDARDSTRIDLRTNTSDSTISIVAAASFDVLGHVTMGSNEKFVVTAAGEFELLATESILLNAGGADLTGDYLNVVSENGSIIGSSQEEFFSTSPAFTVSTSNEIVISSNDLLHLDAELSIAFDGNFASFAADSIDMEAIRNNILLQSYAYQSIEVNQTSIRARGDATIDSGNGLAGFFEVHNLLLNAADDMVLDAHDLFLIESDSFQVSSRDIYFLSDGESHFRTSDGIFDATSNIQLFDGGLLLVETTVGDIALTVTGGNWRSTAADYTKFISEKTITFAADQSISFISNQGIDLRAERGDIYVGRSATGLPNAEPVYFTSDDYVRFKGSDVSVNATYLDVFSNEYIKFEAELRSSTITIDVDEDFITATNGTFFLGSSGITVNSNRDLILAARDDLLIAATYTSSSNILLDASNAFTERANNFEAHTDLFLFNSFDDIDFISSADTTLRSLKETEFNVGTSLTIGVDDSVNINSKRNALYRTGPVVYNTNSVIYESGSIDMVATNNIALSPSQVISIIAVNAQFDADDLLFNTKISATYTADRFVILNGDQLYQYPTITLNGNTYFTSPPNKDIDFDSTTLTTTGPFSISSADVLISAVDATFSPYEFSIESDIEYPININAGSFTQYAFDTAFRVNDFGYFDNEFIFDAADTISIFSGSITLNPDHLLLFEIEDDFDIQSTDGFSVDAFEADILATGKILFELTGLDLGLDTNSISALERVRFYSFDDILLDVTDGVHSITGTTVFLRTLDLLTETMGDDGQYEIEAVETSFTGGDFTITTSGFNPQSKLSIVADNELNFYAEDEFTFSAAIVGVFNAVSIFEMHSDSIYFNAGDTNSITATFGADLLAAEGGTINVIQDTSLLVENTIHSEFDTFINSNDELLYQIGNDFIVTAADITFDTYAQDAGQYFYSTNSISITTDVGDVIFAVSDVASNGALISITASESAYFEADGAITIDSTGQTYDPYLAHHVGILARADDTITITAFTDVELNDESSSSFLSKSGKYTHTGGNVDLTSVDQSIIIDSDTDVNFIGNTLDYEIDDYSIWQATRDILMDQGTSLFMTGGAGWDIVADRGEVGFKYDGNEEMTWTAKTINSQGADDFIWKTGKTDVVANSIEYFGDAELTINANTDISFDINNNGHITSSLNNDILYSGGGDLTINPVGFASFTAVKDIEWLTVGDASFTSRTGDVKFISKGSIDAIAQTALRFTGEDFVGTIYNYADFEVQVEINIGATTPGIVTFNLGGNTLNYGAKIDTTTADISTQNNDILIDSTIFESDAGAGNLLSATNAITIESQGTNSVGEDIYFTSNGDLTIASTNSIASTAASIHYDYNYGLAFSSTGLFTIQSSTFVHFDLDQDFRTTAATWRLTSNSFAFSSVSDATFSSAAGAISFATSKTMVYESDQDTLFKTTGGTTFRTDQSNSPITFYSQDPTSRFILAANSLDATSVAKLDFIGKNGFELTASAVTIQAADTFKTDTKGDIEYVAAGDLEISAQSTRSNIDIQSTGEIFESAATFIDSGTQQISFIPDVDLSFNVGIREDAVDPSITIRATDDFNIDTSVGGFNFYSVYDTSFKVGNFDWIVNGIDSEYQFGASFASLSSGLSITSQGSLHNDGDLLVTSQNLYFNSGYGLTFSGSSKTASTITYALSDDILFQTTEHPTAINIFATDLTVSADDIFLHAFGNEPASGYMSFKNTVGAIDATLAPYLQTGDAYSMAFVTTSSGISFVAEDARFLAEVSQDTFIYQNQNGGDLIVHAAGSDEYLRGIESVASTIQIRSDKDVTNRAENIVFKELYGNPNTIINPSVNEFLTESGRPSIVSIHDQTWTAYGENRNGNGIEFTSTVPIFDIGFEVENVVFNSGNSMQILGGKGFSSTTTYDSDIISHSSIIMEAQGAGVDSNSVYFSAGKDSTSATLPLYIGPDIRYYADGDIYLDSVDKIVAEIRDNIRMEAEGDLVHSAGNGIDITVPYHTLVLFSVSSLEFSAPNIYVSGYDVNFDTRDSFTMIANGEQGPANIYFGTTGIEGNTVGLPTLDFNANTVLFDAPNVDITSDTALIMPHYGGAAPGSCASGTIWFFDDPTIDNLVEPPSVFWCDQLGIANRFYLLAD